MKHKILITSAGSGVSQNVLETLEGRRQNLSIMGTDASAETPSYVCDKVYLTPVSERPPSDFATALIDIITEESPDIIIPGRDIDVIILAMLKDRLPAIRDRFLTGTAVLAEMMEDKWLSYQFSKKESLPFADSIPFDPLKHRKPLDAFAEKHGFPLIIKPRKGYASKGVHLVMNPDQLYNNPTNGQMIVQEYLGTGDKITRFQNHINRVGLPLFYSLEDEKYSLQMYLAKDRSLKGSFVTAHKMVNGISVGVSRAEDFDFGKTISIFSEVFSKHGWSGPLNIQLQKSNETGELKAYEFNGRYTGATAARYFLGYDEVGLAMDDVCRGDLPKDNLCGSQRTVKRQSFVSRIPDQLVRILKRNGNWKA